MGFWIKFYKFFEWLNERMDPMELTNLYEPFKEKALKVKENAAKVGANIVWTQGYRSFEMQDGLYAQGRTKPGKKVTNAKGGQSMHNYGLALDFAFIRNGVLTWHDLMPWDLIGQLAKNEGLEWGGDWKGFKDRPHIQYPVKSSMSELKHLYENGRLVKVWESLKQK